MFFVNAHGRIITRNGESDLVVMGYEIYNNMIDRMKLTLELMEADHNLMTAPTVYRICFVKVAVNLSFPIFSSTVKKRKLRVVFRFSEEGLQTDIRF